MGADIIVTFGSIQDELEKAKCNLKGLNDNIRRIVGRDPSDATQLRGDRKRSFGSLGGADDKKRGGAFDFGSSDKNRRHNSPPSKRRHTIQAETKSVFSRLSGPPPSRQLNNTQQQQQQQQHVFNSPDDGAKPKLSSRVIREMPTRQEIVAAQGTDAASVARSRRMFGSLMGTLQKFCQEESRLKPKEDRKAQIEKKLEDQQQLEREKMKRERQDLFQNRKRQQVEIKMLETKMTRMKELGTWEEAQKPLMNFVRTKAKPHIYYLPKVLDGKTEKKLEESRAVLEKSIAKKRADTTDELAEIENQFRAGESSAAPDRQSKNGNTHPDEANDSHQDGSNKHNRRNSMLDDEDDEEDADDNSPFHASDDQDQTLFDNTIIEPDLSLLKTERVESITAHTNDDRSEPDDGIKAKTEVMTDDKHLAIGSDGVEAASEQTTVNEMG